MVSSNIPQSKLRGDDHSLLSTCINMATVIGPTPPGTGVMKEAFSFAELYATSPTTLFPLAFVLSGDLRRKKKKSYTSHFTRATEETALTEAEVFSSAGANKIEAEYPGSCKER